MAIGRVIEVFKTDQFGRSDLAGYGFAHIPMHSGSNEFEISCWRPLGTPEEETETFFLGGTPSLTKKNIIYDKAWDKRNTLTTVGTGKVLVRIDIMLRWFRVNGLEF